MPKTYFCFQPIVYQSASASSTGSYSTGSGGNLSISLATTSTSARRSKNLYAVKLAIQAQSKREQEMNRLQRDHKSQTAVERPTTLHLKPVRTAAERHAHKTLEVNKSTIKAVVDKSNHRRSQSETNQPTYKKLRPRYLDPKQQTTYAVEAPQQAEAVVNMSSSEDSSTRNSKLALNKRLAITEASKSNMSRDSLASPTKPAVAAGPQCTVSTVSEVDLSIDSLGGSMHSSIKSLRSNKSVSQESLVRFNATVRAKNLNANRLRQPSNRLSSSNEHSPTSASTTSTNTATKNSRLSSIRSTASSTNDSALRRNTCQSTVPLRRSFVSAKSREILAAKQNAPTRNSTNKTTTNSDANSFTAATPSNKRPISYPTTLHLRRTAKLSPSQVEVNASPTSSNKFIRSQHPPIAPKHTKVDHHQASKTKPSQDTSSKCTVHRIEKSTTKSITKSIVATKYTPIRETGKTTSLVPKKKPSDNEIDVLTTLEDIPVVSRAATRVESKLERSSTFCKESSSLNTTTVAPSCEIVNNE